MGKRRIDIKRIQDERTRQVTFSKRKYGLMKKAFELSAMCGVDVGIIMITPNNKLYTFANENMDNIIMRVTEHGGPIDSKTNKSIEAHGLKFSGEESPNREMHFNLISGGSDATTISPNSSGDAPQNYFQGMTAWSTQPSVVSSNAMSLSPQSPVYSMAGVPYAVPQFLAPYQLPPIYHQLSSQQKRQQQQQNFIPPQ